MDNKPEIADPIPNWIAGQEVGPVGNDYFEKLDPRSGRPLCRVARSQAADVAQAVCAAVQAFPAWADTPAVQRGLVLHALVLRLQERKQEIAEIVAAETGKSCKDALGETGAAIQLGLFFASEGQRLYGRTTTSSVKNRSVTMVRQPLGVAGLIVAANTPIANVAWKTFPALVCGNSVVLKAAEDTPATAWFFGKLAHEAGLPPGTLNVIQGLGKEAGAALVDNSSVDLISFTGSAAVGREIAVKAGGRMARVSLELGGKNPLVVCDDADLEKAVNWSLLSAFSNAGQRCAAASRLIIFSSVYDRFRDALVQRTEKLKVGPSDDDDLGPVINNRQLTRMIGAVEKAQAGGARILTGGKRVGGKAHAGGFYMTPTVIENVAITDEISCEELFGPITCLYPAKDFQHALELANHSPYGLTACIHTTSLDRAMYFAEKVRSGVVSINAGTYGSEPHLPFGGFKQSGNGTREPGTEALDVYSELKNVLLNIDPNQL